MKLKVLVGSGGKIMLTALPFIITGVIFNILYPRIFSVGGPNQLLQILSIVILIPGLIVWVWSVILILSCVPKKKLITSGPYSIVMHPLYTGVSLLVLPWIGFLLNTWLGFLLGLVVYFASRTYSMEEEKMLAGIFGAEWESYLKKIRIKWL